MSWLDRKTGKPISSLDFREHHFCRSLRTSNRKEVEGSRKRAEANLTEVKRGGLHMQVVA
jgi:hypothetical protein